MNMSAVDQKRIARNTLLLYVRMGCLMLVSLYTSRVVLDALGMTDNGLYQTAAGVVLTFAFLSNTMSTACQRFFGIELGRNDKESLRNVFCLCVEVFIAIALIVVLLCETVGIWLLDRKIQVDGRMDAAMWVFQCAIISFVFTIIRTPYQGMIIIKEKMKVFTYISVFEALGNLAIALVISGYSNDRLKLYGTLMMLVNILVSLYYIMYCTRFYEECRVRLYWNREGFLKIFDFAGWNMVGSMANVLKSQGLTILINIFFGNIMVSARAMSYRVYATLQQFVDNFVLAIKPQMIKSYSAGDVKGMLGLVCQGSKFSFFLMLLVSLPICLETDMILDIWLKDVPDMTSCFARLVIVNALIEVLANPLATAMQAYGKIRVYQIVTGGVLLLIVPVSWLLLKLGMPVQTVFWVSIVICAVGIGIRVVFVHNAVGLSIPVYLKSVIAPIVVVSAVSASLPVALELLMPAGWGRLLCVCTVSVLMTATSVFLLGVTRTERRHLIEYIVNNVISKFHAKG